MIIDGEALEKGQTKEVKPGCKLAFGDMAVYQVSSESVHPPAAGSKAELQSVHPPSVKIAAVPGRLLSSLKL